MALEELSFGSVNGRTDGRTDDGQKVITIAHPEHSSGELNMALIMLHIKYEKPGPFGFRQEDF